MHFVEHVKFRTLPAVYFANAYLRLSAIKLDTGHQRCRITVGS